MKKFFITILILSLVLFTALIKNSTKRIDDEIFVLRENIRFLKKDFEKVKLEHHYLSSAEKLLEFQDKYLTFSSGNSEVSYSYCDASLVVRPPNKEVALPSIDVTFKMPSSVYDSVVKAAMVLQVPEVAIVGDGAKMKLVAYESKNTMSDKFS